MQKKRSTAVRSSAQAPTPAPKRGPAAKRPAKGLQEHDVLGALCAEHRYAARLLDLLDEQRGALSRGEPLDVEGAVAAMAYMTEHNDAYHHPREDAMFARLQKRDPHLMPRIAEV